MAIIRQNYNFLVIAIGAIGTIIAIGTIVAIGTPNDPIILSGDGEKGIAIEWSHWIHYNGSNGRRLNTIIGDLDLIAIGANGTSICSIEWIQWRQLPHSPNFFILYLF